MWKTCAWYHTHKSSAADTVPKANTIKSPQCNRVQSRSMVEAIHKYEQRNKNRSQEWFSEGHLWADEQFIVSKEYGTC